MRLTDGQVKMMQEEMYAELIQILMEKYAYTMEQAMDALYNSETFARLQDARTGLYQIAKILTITNRIIIQPANIARQRKIVVQGKRLLNTRRSDRPLSGFTKIRGSVI